RNPSRVREGAGRSEEPPLLVPGAHPHGGSPQGALDVFGRDTLSPVVPGQELRVLPEFVSPGCGQELDAAGPQEALGPRMGARLQSLSYRVRVIGSAPFPQTVPDGVAYGGRTVLAEARLAHDALHDELEHPGRPVVLRVEW